MSREGAHKGEAVTTLQGLGSVTAVGGKSEGRGLQVVMIRGRAGLGKPGGGNKQGTQPRWGEAVVGRGSSGFLPPAGGTG